MSGAIYGLPAWLGARRLAAQAGAAQGQKPNLAMMLNLNGPDFRDNERARMQNEQARAGAGIAALFRRQLDAEDSQREAEQRSALEAEKAERNLGQQSLLERLRQEGRASLQDDRQDAAAEGLNARLAGQQGLQGERIAAQQGMTGQRLEQQQKQFDARMKQTEKRDDRNWLQKMFGVEQRQEGLDQGQQRIDLQKQAQAGQEKYRAAVLKLREAEAVKRGEQFDKAKWAQSYMEAERQAPDQGPEDDPATPSDERNAWIIRKANEIYSNVKAGPGVLPQ